MSVIYLVQTKDIIKEFMINELDSRILLQLQKESSDLLKGMGVADDVVDIFDEEGLLVISSKIDIKAEPCEVSTIRKIISETGE
jgi:hypothetical protein